MKKKSQVLLRVLLVFVLSALAAIGLSWWIHPKRYVNPGGNALTVRVPSLEGNEVHEKEVILPRGTEVELRNVDGDTATVLYDGELLQLPVSALAQSLQDCVTEKQVYVRHIVNLQEEKDGALSGTTAREGEMLKVVSADAKDLDQETGMVKWYEVSKNGRVWWIPGDAVETVEEQLDAWNGGGAVHSTYWDQFYGDGYSDWAFDESLDWKPLAPASFPDNQMPESVRGIHVQAENLASDPDWYLKFLQEHDLNTLVVELKNEGGIVFYDSDVVPDYLPEPEQAVYAAFTQEQLEQVMKKFQEAGIYTVARVSVFKDRIFAQQNPEESLQELDGSLLTIAGSEWASPYSRKAWMYNAGLAEELSQWFDEVQLDYVRFPEGLAQLQGQFDDHNLAGESKASVLQNFVRYVTERLREKETYLTTDIFALTVLASDDQDLGQYAPALLLVCDAVSPMPYSDHFSAGSMGIEAPWEDPGLTIYKYSQSARQVFPDAGSYRPWLQGYSLEPGQLEEQIQAVYDNGFTSWLVWSAGGSKEELKKAFD